MPRLPLVWPLQKMDRQATRCEFVKAKALGVARVFFVLLSCRGLFIIDPQGTVRQITINDLPVGRSVDETLRLIQAFQFVEKHGEGTSTRLFLKTQDARNIFDKKNNHYGSFDIQLNEHLCSKKTASVSEAFHSVGV